MIDVRPFASLGHADHGWLDARHHFSFANYYDPRRLGWGAIKVWNDDRIAAKSGTAEVGDTGNVHSWITGFDASENPRAAVTIVVEDEPPGVGHQTVVSGMKAIMEAVVTE